MKKSQLPILLALLLPVASRAAELTASDRAANDHFGYSVSLSGNIGFVGAYGDDDKGGASGSAYVFRNLDTASGGVTQNAKLTASDGKLSDYLGYSVSLSGSIGLIGATQEVTAGGSAYVFRNLDTVSGSKTQDLKLTATDAAFNDSFGRSVSLAGSIGLIGAYSDDDAGTNSGSAYVYRHLDTASGSKTQDVKLTASDGAAGDGFGYSVSLSGSIGLVGAYGDDDKGADSGAAYVFRNLDTASGSGTEDTKLTASDGETDDRFGASVSVSGNIGLVGAYADDDKGLASGSVYVFRNLDTASGSKTEDAKLIASDGEAFDQFGASVSLSGSIGLVGAYFDDDKGSDSGSAYVFRNLDTVIGSVTQNVKLLASDAAANDQFGVSVSIDGDNFIIGAMGKNSRSGKAYSGSVSSVTTLNEGHADRTISSLSFISQDDWIIGQTMDHNTVTLSAGNTANVTASGKAVYIGQNGGSDHNMLALDGALIASEVYIGSTAGNEGNTLQIDTAATFGAITLRLAPGNVLSLEGDYTNTAALFARLGPALLQGWDNDLNIWTSLTTENAADFITASFSSGYTAIRAVPEPSTFALIALSLGVLLLRRRSRRE